MKNLLLHYIKYFLIITATFTLMIMGLDLLFGDEVVLGKRIKTGILIGIIMSSFGYYSHSQRLKWMEINPVKKDDLKTHQSKMISSGLPPDMIKSKIEVSPYFSKSKIETNDNTLKLKSKSSLSTWGEVVSINLVSKNGDNHEYKVTSRPRLKTNILDAGKNLENVFMIERILKSA